MSILKLGDYMKKILITGARSGIIEEVIKKIKKKRYQIYVTVHTNSQLKAVEKKYKKYKNIKCFKLDIIQKEDRKLIENLDIDILINNAAIGEGGSIAEIDMNKVRYNYEVNVFSSFEIVQLVLRKMIEKNSGKIIIMSSLAGIYSPKFMGVYASTKASIIKLTTTLRKELKLIHSNIKIVMIEPGFYHTGFNQVMFQNKYDWMDTDTYFEKCLDLIHKREHFIEKYIEKKELDSITSKIVFAIKTKHPDFIYRAPFSQVLFSKLYQLFFE